jgi:hypothetical protein
MMARNDTRDPLHDDARTGDPTSHRRWEFRPEGSARRPVANSLTVVGTLLIVLGGWSILREVGLLPDVVADLVGDWWAAALVVGGAWLFRRGRRATGTAVALLGAVILTVSLVPSQLIGPVLLIGAGIVLVIGAMGGRRWFAGRPAEALFDEVHGSLFPERSVRSIVAIFDDVTGAIDVASGSQGPVECLAVFGDVKVTVPHDVAIELRQTAVFGDVRSPEPPTVTPVATVQMRATSVFGDVRITRS